MKNDERIEKLEKQVKFLTEELVDTDEIVINLYSKIDEVSKASLERDMNQLKLIKLLSDQITNLIKKLES